MRSLIKIFLLIYAYQINAQNINFDVSDENLIGFLWHYTHESNDSLVIRFSQDSIYIKSKHETEAYGYNIYGQRVKTPNQVQYAYSIEKETINDKTFCFLTLNENTAYLIKHYNMFRTHPAKGESQNYFALEVKKIDEFEIALLKEGKYYRSKN